MKSQYRISFILALILVVLNALTLLQYKDSLKRHAICEENYLITLTEQQKTDYYLDLIHQSVLNKMQREALTKRHPLLQRLIGEDEKLVLFIPQSDCNQCLVSAFINVENLGDVIGNDNILVVTNWTTIDGRMVKAIDMGLDFEWYHIDSFNLPVEELNELFMFVTDSEFNIKLLFVPGWNSIEKRMAYYNDILINYFIPKAIEE